MADTPKVSYVTVKIRASIHKKLRQVATFEGVNIADLASDILEKPAEAKYREMQKKMEKENGK